MFGELEAFREIPLPPQEVRLQAKKGYRAWRIDEVSEGRSEPLVDMKMMGMAGRNFYHDPRNPPYYASIPGSIEKLYARKTVVEKLLRVQKKLKPAGLELYVFDGWRPAAVQSYMHDVWVPRRLAAEHPDWSDEEIAALVNQYWAAGPSSDADIDPVSPPPHSTGGALDLTLRWIGGDPLWMGTIVEEVSERAHTGALESAPPPLPFSDDEALKNRRLLYALMHAEGFQNNPTEWWHFSYGDQMWAKLASAERNVEVPAFYSNIMPE